MFEPSYPGPPVSKQSNDNDSANGTSSLSESGDEDQIRIKFADWGFKIDRLFEVAYRFYKRNEGKAFHPSFDERNKMIALIMQARYGNIGGGKAPELGVLDLVGKGRQHEWSLLDGMSKTEAMSKFICALEDLCPFFKAHAEAVKLSSGVELGTTTGELTPGNETSGIIQTKSEMDTQMHNIYSSLCKQTYNQFKGYAEKQYPDDTVKQKYLITSLQEQYYQQYISQMHPDLKSSLPDSSRTSNESSNIPSSLPSPAASDKSSHVQHGSPNADKISKNSTVIPENHLALVPEAPHLELPLPTLGDEGENYLKTNENTLTVSNKLMSNSGEGDTCREVDADISSEELNSEFITAVSPPAQTVADDLARGLTSVSLAQDNRDTEFVKTDSSHEDLMKPVRFPSNPDFSPIGAFESFPEPKPIKSTQSQKSTPIDQINPNLPHPAPIEVPNDYSVVQNECLEGSANDEFNQNKPSLINDKPEPNISVADQPDAAGQQTFDYNQTSQPDTNGQQCHGDVASHQVSQPADLHENQNNLASSGYDENSESHHHHQHQLDVNYQGPDLWDTVSSSGGGHSPVQQQLIAYEEPEPATTWSKREINEFKESLGDDKQGGIYEVKESTLVIIQVPTYPDGKYIYWEFATDDFDIGFGLDFVYERHLSEPLALNIYEELDEDDMDDMIEEDEESSWPAAAKPPNSSQPDPELGLETAPNQLNSNQAETRQRMLSEKRQRMANTISIVPTYRRDSHQEVFVGRHKYPGQGYYLLRFDNTYSVLRSKTLYFRICYFM